MLLYNTLQFKLKVILLSRGLQYSMNILRTNKLDMLKGFSASANQLAIVCRQVPSGADSFFQTLMQTSFSVTAEVRKECALNDIRAVLATTIPDNMQRVPFYHIWLSDMAKISEVFCQIQTTDSVSFWLGSERGCRRYHVDNVSLRMLLTYAGKGTEWLSDVAADRQAFLNGEPNEKILKDKSARQFMKQWAVAVFRGGPKGLLHQTPDAALRDPSILMWLDHPSIWRTLRTDQK